MSEYPEHEKMMKISELSQSIGQFLDWLQYDKEYLITEYNKNHQEYIPILLNIKQLLAEYFQIDLDKIEKERQQMLEVLRASQR